VPLCGPDHDRFVERDVESVMNPFGGALASFPQPVGPRNVKQNARGLGRLL
jgi:hypothetical protein